MADITLKTKVDTQELDDRQRLLWGHRAGRKTALGDGERI